MSDYIIEGRIQMRSAIADQASVDLWDYVQDGNGNVWLWPVNHIEPGAMVHVGSITVGKRSEGYAGRTMRFPTKDGDILIQGPWHSNTDALYKATGKDLRDKHLTWGVISKGRKYLSDHRTVMVDVLHIDPTWGVVGMFERIDNLAQAFADERDEVVYYYCQSHGGSSCGPVYPTGKSPHKLKKAKSKS